MTHAMLWLQPSLSGGALHFAELHLYLRPLMFVLIVGKHANKSLRLLGTQSLLTCVQLCMTTHCRLVALKNPPWCEAGILPNLSVYSNFYNHEAFLFFFFVNLLRNVFTAMPLCHCFKGNMNIEVEL